jgi:hypothetical protein
MVANEGVLYLFVNRLNHQPVKSTVFWDVMTGRLVEGNIASALPCCMLDT